MDFEWDEIKREKIKVERGFGFETAATIFNGVTLEEIDERSDYGEIRFRAIGKIENRCYTVIYTDRLDEEGIMVRRIITAWKSNTKEQRLWQMFEKK